MKDLLFYSIIGVGGIVAYKFYNASKLAKNINCSIEKIKVNGTSDGNTAFQLGVTLRVSNTNREDITLNNSNLKVYANGKLAGNCILPYTQVIKGNAETCIYLLCNIYYKNAFSEWWNLFIQSLQSILITISGNIKIGGVSIPIPAINIKEFKISDIWDKYTSLMEDE